MKRIFLTLIVLLISWNCFAADGALKYGIAPSNPNSRDSLKAFVKFLGDAVGTQMELVEMDPDQLLKAVSSGEVALADLSSNVYAIAKETYKDKIQYVITVAARNEKGDLVPYYKGVFFVLKDSPYKNLLDLKGKSFAYVNPVSTSGYLYPMATLRSLGINPDNFFTSITFAGNHEKIFEGIKSGFLDAGVSNYEAWEKAKTMHGNIFKIIGVTDDIPSGAIVAAASLDRKTIFKIQDVLKAIKPADPIVNYPGFFYKGFIKKSSSFYDMLNRMLRQFEEQRMVPYP